MSQVSNLAMVKKETILTYLISKNKKGKPSKVKMQRWESKMSLLSQLITGFLSLYFTKEYDKLMARLPLEACS
jgi:hypothetical protein